MLVVDGGNACESKAAVTAPDWPTLAHRETSGVRWEDGTLPRIAGAEDFLALPRRRGRFAPAFAGGPKT